jgi:hypothetical protein
MITITKFALMLGVAFAAQAGVVRGSTISAVKAQENRRGAEGEVESLSHGSSHRGPSVDPWAARQRTYTSALESTGWSLRLGG